jgi:hypothetical protein
MIPRERCLFKPVNGFIEPEAEALAIRRDSLGNGEMNNFV